MNIVGIDLGTSNSLIGYWCSQDKQPRLIPNALGALTTPSVVSLDDNHDVLVGDAAVDRLVSHPQRSAALFKRQMGSAGHILLDGRAFSPEQLSSLVITQLLDDAQAHFGYRPEEAVISVPAYFSDAQRSATKLAGEMAGLRVERLINEPTAAALAYGIATAPEQRAVAVVDLGGGTLDVSILEYFYGIMQVRATTGDRTLGGADFDFALVDHLLAGKGLSRDALSDTERACMLRRAREAKHTLSNRHSAEFELGYSSHGSSATLGFTITRAEFEKVSAPMLARIAATIERALRDAGLCVGDLQDVLLVGGATRLPMVRLLVGRLFRRMPLTTVAAEQAIARGAAVQAGLKARDAALDDFVLTDVAPWTLGIEVAVERDGQYEPGHYLPLIERNSPVPVSRVQTVSRLTDDQTSIHCRVFQGESRRVANNILLGEFQHSLHGDESDVDVRFTYDVNGILEVTTAPEGAVPQQRLVVSDSKNKLGEEEIQAALAVLADLKIHPRERMVNRTLLARAERMYEEALGQRRQEIGDLAQWFESMMASQDDTLVGEARTTLTQLLDQIDVDPRR